MKFWIFKEIFRTGNYLRHQKYVLISFRWPPYSETQEKCYYKCCPISSFMVLNIATFCPKPHIYDNCNLTFKAIVDKFFLIFC